MYGFGGVGLSEVQISISELSVVGGGWWVVDGTNALHGRTFTGSDKNQIHRRKYKCSGANRNTNTISLPLLCEGHQKPHKGANKTPPPVE